MTNHPKRNGKFLLVRSDAGDGGWSLHHHNASDEDIASGDAPVLTSGMAEWDEASQEWSRPNAADYAVARQKA